MAEAMPPPIAPPESICIIMNTGKTSAMPASASVPRRETHQVSISPVEACASMTRMFGQARRSSVGRMAPSSSRRVRGLMAGTAAPAGRAAPAERLRLMARLPPARPAVRGRGAVAVGGVVARQVGPEREPRGLQPLPSRRGRAATGW